MKASMNRRRKSNALRKENHPLRQSTPRRRLKEAILADNIYNRDELIAAEQQAKKENEEKNRLEDEEKVKHEAISIVSASLADKSLKEGMRMVQKKL